MPWPRGNRSNIEDRRSDLLDGNDENVISQNIADLRRKGYPESEAIGIAMRKARRSDSEDADPTFGTPELDAKARAAFPSTGNPDQEPGRANRRAPRTAKGVDIELYEADGQAPTPPMTPTPKAPKAKPQEDEGLVERIVNKTPFGKAKKALKGS